MNLKSITAQSMALLRIEYAVAKQRRDCIGEKKYGDLEMADQSRYCSV